MPPKKGKTAKKKAARSSEDDIQLGNIDVQYNPDIVYSLLTELSQNVEAKCAQIQKDSDFLATSIQQAFHLELIKLPNQVKNMSIKRFKEEFGLSLEAVTRGAIVGGANKASSRTDYVFEKNHRVSQRFMQTPANPHKYSGCQTPSLRNPREGEQLLSKNGSPLGEFTTVKKAPKGDDAVSLVPPTPGVFMPLTSGEVVDMENLDVDNMTKENKEETLQKMQEVMQNMQSLMAKLSQPPAV